ncbi:HIRAN domain-containing protein [Massilimaliae timonensis]|uniref:HIRAN domain-containing protein n=1 Tax=Massiliimalia timonensis TaxID=1987501 RepID=A0A8J6TRS5_9FIRM|nr:HIRAN domain-containing protein [Massiliimalia timonensis]
MGARGPSAVSLCVRTTGNFICGLARQWICYHDSQAIVIKNTDGVKIGYVPRADNLIFSRLMDAGKLLFGRISYKEMMGKWLKIDIKIYLHES